MASLLISSICLSQECGPGYTEINELCFHDGDLNVLQKMIDNSYQSGIDLGCQEDAPYCGSPNPFMDDQDSWMGIAVDGAPYEWNANGNGIVEPLELGIQEWENGRLTSLMCGAYIYCQLSGPIPDEIIELTEIETLRLEINYLNGFIPDTICGLGLNYNDHLEFDISGNRLCPPYPDCIDIQGGPFWYQDTSQCNQIGDINYDGSINILDVIILISSIVSSENIDFQALMISDTNADGQLDVLDVVELINTIIG